MYDWKNLHRICPSLVFGNVELDRFEVTTAWRHQKPPPTEFQLGSNVQSKTHFRLLLWKARKILSEENHPSVIAQKKNIKDHFQDRVHGMEPIKIFFNWSKALEAQSSSCHNYFLKIGYSRPLFLNFCLFYLNAQRSDNLFQCWDSTHGSLVLEAPALPSEPQTLSCCHNCLSCHKLQNCRIYCIFP